MGVKVYHTRAYHSYAHNDSDLAVSVCTFICHTLVLCHKSSAVAEMGDRLATIDMG